MSGCAASDCAKNPNFRNPINAESTVQSFAKKYFALPVGQIISTSPRHPASIRGALAIVTNVGRDAMDASLCRKTSGTAADGEVVWSCSLDAEIKLVRMPKHRTDDGDKKARSPGRARNKPLKPIAQGRPE